MVESVSGYADTALISGGEKAANVNRLILCAVLVVASSIYEVGYFMIHRKRIRYEVDKLTSFRVRLRHANPLQLVLIAVLNVVATLMTLLFVCQQSFDFLPIANAFAFAMPVFAAGV